jgi:16S rRNA (uracil1498-N3)-methyltransferase
VIELFDDAGNTAPATLLDAPADTLRVHVDALRGPSGHALRLTVAAAIPKGPRADWMIEKLSEIGVDRFIPLATARGVVLPEGKNKLDRWARLATEAARQSRRTGVMSIAPLTPVPQLVAALTEARAEDSAEAAWYLSTAPEAHPLTHLLHTPPPTHLTLLIGPEGGWTEAETTAFAAARLGPLSLTSTILRIETAALLAAGATLSLLRPQMRISETSPHPQRLTTGH